MSYLTFFLKALAVVATIEAATVIALGGARYLYLWLVYTYGPDLGWVIFIMSLIAVILAAFFTWVFKMCDVGS